MLSKTLSKRYMAVLAEQWSEFVEHDAKGVLLWHIGNESQRQYVTQFVNSESGKGGSTPDFFVPLMTPFNDRPNYGFELSRELMSRSKTDSRSSGKNEPKRQWSNQHSTAEKNGISAFAALSASFQQHYKDQLDTLAIVLTPSSCSDEIEFCRWVTEWLDAVEEANVRLIIVLPMQSSRQSLPNDWCHDKLHHSIVDDSVLESESGNLSAAQNRRLQRYLMSLNESANKGEQRQALVLAKRALTIATANQWIHWQCIVYLSLGSILLLQTNTQKALSAYQHAHRLALSLEESGDELASMLVLQCNRALAAAFELDKNYLTAATQYLRSTLLAKALKDDNLAISGLRNAGLCYERKKEYKNAWRCGEEALAMFSRLGDEKKASIEITAISDLMQRLDKKIRNRRIANDVFKFVPFFKSA